MNIGTKRATFCAVVIQSLVLSACDDDPKIDADPEVPPTGAGVWTGTATPVGGGAAAAVAALVLDDGTAMIRLDPVVVPPSTSATRYMMTGTLCCNQTIDSQLPAAAPTPIGSQSLPGIRVQGTVGQTQFTGSMTSIFATSPSHSLALTRAAGLFERGMSFNTLSGTYTWTQPVTSGGTTTNYVLTLTISNTGAITGGVAPGTCMFNGQVSIPNPARNYFRIDSFNVSNCTNGGASYGLNFNATYPGLGFLADDTARPGTTNNLLVFYANSGSQYWPIYVYLR